MTRSRLVSIAAVIGVVALVVWVARNTYWGEITVPTPLRGEAARNPFYAAQHVAEALGARTARQPALGATSSDAVVVLSFWGWDISVERREELERWVEAGGRLVVDNSLITGSDVFERWSGVARIRYEEEESGEQDFSVADQAEPCTELREDLPDGELEPSDAAAQRLVVCGIEPDSWLASSRPPIWAMSDEVGAQVVRVSVGRGSVTVINTEPFRYRRFLTSNHGALFVAATQLKKGDEIVFMAEDDYDSLLSLAWRYGAPVVVLLLLFVALGLWRGGVRFGPVAPPAESARRSLAEQIRGTGRFALRLGGGAALHAATLRALAEAASRRIAGYERLQPSERLAALASAAAVDRVELAAAMNYAAERRSPELRSALALLESARRQLLIRS
jgi:hypothetical protein